MLQARRNTKPLRGNDLRSRCDHPAFTYVELILAVIIVGVLASIAVPRFTNFLTHHRLDAAARRVAADLAFAQRRAKFSTTAHKVKFLTGDKEYLLPEVKDPDHPSQVYTVHLEEPPYGATIVSADFGGDAEIIFDGYGVPNSDGTIVLAVGDYQRTLTLDVQTGRVSVSEVSEGPSPPPEEPPPPEEQ